VLHLCALTWATAATLRLVAWASEHNQKLGTVEAALQAELETETVELEHDLERTLNLPPGAGRFLHSHLAHPLRFFIAASSTIAGALLICSSMHVPSRISVALFVAWKVAACVWATYTAVHVEQLAFVAWQKAHKEAASALQPLCLLAEKVTLGIGALLCLYIAGIPLAPLLALGSVGGLSVGLATQTVAANIVSGAALLVARPFSMGDKIDLPGRNLLGVVRRFGIDSTTITLDDSTPVHIPNSELAKSTIRNTSRRTLWPVTASFRLSHAALASGLAGEVAKRLEEYARSRPDFKEHGPQFVCRGVVSDISADAVIVSLITYIASPGVDLATFERRRSDVLLRASEIVTKDMGLQLALPTSALMQYVDGAAVRR
jgi:hypothetical protein